MHTLGPGTCVTCGSFSQVSYHPPKVPLSLSSLTDPHCSSEPYLSFSPHRLWRSHHFRSYCGAIEVSVSSTYYL